MPGISLEDAERLRLGLGGDGEVVCRIVCPTCGLERGRPAIAVAGPACDHLLRGTRAFRNYRGGDRRTIDHSAGLEARERSAGQSFDLWLETEPTRGS
ncbi:MAG TPA: hypothetical protein VLL48_09895 [Longimicrobiales bacterium]|nr:hypothetical protein [Longimicrobiales bacterium]